MLVYKYITWVILVILLLKEAFAISLGNGRNVIIDDQNGYQYTGRIEFLPMGEFTGQGDYYGADLAMKNIKIFNRYNSGL